MYLQFFSPKSSFTIYKYPEFWRNRAGDTWGGSYVFLTFLSSKKKNGKLKEKQRVSKQKLLNSCHQGQNISVLAIPEPLEFKTFSCHPTMAPGNTFQCSMAVFQCSLKSISLGLRKNTTLIWFSTADSSEQNVVSFLLDYSLLPWKRDFS